MQTLQTFSNTYYPSLIVAIMRVVQPGVRIIALSIQQVPPSDHHVGIDHPLVEKNTKWYAFVVFESDHTFATDASTVTRDQLVEGIGACRELYAAMCNGNDKVVDQAGKHLELILAGIGIRPIYPHPNSMAEQVREIMADDGYGPAWEWTDDRAAALDGLTEYRLPH